MPTSSEIARQERLAAIALRLSADALTPDEVILAEKLFKQALRKAHVLGYRLSVQPDGTFTAHKL